MECSYTCDYRDFPPSLPACQAVPEITHKICLFQGWGFSRKQSREDWCPLDSIPLRIPLKGMPNFWMRWACMWKMWWSPPSCNAKSWRAMPMGCNRQAGEIWDEGVDGSNQKRGGLGWGDFWMVCRTIIYFYIDLYIYIYITLYDYILYMFLAQFTHILKYFSHA